MIEELDTYFTRYKHISCTASMLLTVVLPTKLLASHLIPLLLLGYEPAGLTVHPPPQNDRGWVHFFRMGV